LGGQRKVGCRRATPGDVDLKNNLERLDRKENGLRVWAGEAHDLDLKFDRQILNLDFKVGKILGADPEGPRMMNLVLLKGRKLLGNSKRF
jgi:hypothetical protein